MVPPCIFCFGGGTLEFTRHVPLLGGHPVAGMRPGDGPISSHSLGGLAAGRPLRKSCAYFWPSAPRSGRRLVDLLNFGSPCTSFPWGARAGLGGPVRLLQAPPRLPLASRPGAIWTRPAAAKAFPDIADVEGFPAGTQYCKGVLGDTGFWGRPGRWQGGGSHPVACPPVVREGGGEGEKKREREREGGNFTPARPVHAGCWGWGLTGFHMMARLLALMRVGGGCQAQDCSNTGALCRTSPPGAVP